MLTILGKRSSINVRKVLWTCEEAGLAYQQEDYGSGFKPLDTPEFQRLNPNSLVPVLLDGEFAVWDSLAICEYAADQHPDAGLWPKDAKARARARSLAAQMHSGFGALRNALPMNIEAHLPGIDMSEAVHADIQRMQALWRETREQFGHGGDFLFGAFSIADAFFAPVVSRFTTYDVPATGAVRDYMDAVLALPAMQEWMRDARAEATFVPEDEPYRKHR
ncbi:MAG: glutathione S-transferase [Klebsiella sp.]|nr:glutathione S-transferase [Klebsiella sp.]